MDKIGTMETEGRWAIIGGSMRGPDGTIGHDFKLFASGMSRIGDDGELPAGRFDSSFFSISPREAVLMDPQHRLLLECAWEALESAAYQPSAFEGRIGVFVGSSDNTYRNNILVPAGLGSSPEDELLVRLANGSDFLATRLSYQLNLTGPAVTVHAGCCTAPAAVHHACQGLDGFECDMALAGAVALRFDGKASTRLALLPSTGLVVIKRLEDALADGDTIHALVFGSAMGFFALDDTGGGVDGHRSTIDRAHLAAGIVPEQVDRVLVGCPDEPAMQASGLQALFRVFGNRRACPIETFASASSPGEEAVGIEWLFRSIERLVPKTAPRNSDRPLTSTEGSNSRNGDTAARSRSRTTSLHASDPLGHCVHLVLAEPPPFSSTSCNRGHFVFPVSGKTPRALNDYCTRLSRALVDLNPTALADAAFTLQMGRSAFGYRRAVIAASGEEAAKQLKEPDARHDDCRPLARDSATPVVFLFSGQGMYDMGTAGSLYKSEPVFRMAVDRCAAILRQRADVEVLQAIPGNGEIDSRFAGARLQQPAIFVVQYAMAVLWRQWGVSPAALLGHSLGELTAACVAGIMNLEHALWLVARRGAIMDALPPGAMAAVALDRQSVERFLFESLEVSAENGPGQLVVSGACRDVDDFIARVREHKIGCVKLKTSSAFHSRMMQPAVQEMFALFEEIPLHPPAIPILSSMTGTWLSDDDAVSPAFWASHARRPVLFGPALAEAVANMNGIYLEMGPGNALTQSGRRAYAGQSLPAFYSCMPPVAGESSGHRDILTIFGRMWEKGAVVDWHKLHEGTRRRRLPLPTYPFEHRTHWPQHEDASQAVSRNVPGRLPFPQWFFVQEWQEKVADSFPTHAQLPRHVLLCLDRGGLGQGIEQLLVQSGVTVTAVQQGIEPVIGQRQPLTIRPGIEEDYRSLFAHLNGNGTMPDTIVTCWDYESSVTPAGMRFDSVMKGFSCLFQLIKAVCTYPGKNNRRLVIISSGLCPVDRQSPVVSEHAVLYGINNVLSQEFPGFKSQIIDLPTPLPACDRSRVLRQAVEEICLGTESAVLAIRADKQLIPHLRDYRPATTLPEKKILRPKGVYLITGGLGGIGLTLAAGLAREVQARLALVGRRSVTVTSGGGKRAATSPLAERTIRQMAASGAEVCLFRADVADRAQMQSVFAEIKQRWGRIDGIIHAAGVPGGAVLSRMTDDELSNVFMPKIKGALVLDELSRGADLDFMVFCSSLSSLFGGAGQAHYSAANAFLDTFAAERSFRCNGASISIAWDTWSEVGMAVNAQATGSVRRHQQRQLAYGIKPEEGWRVFQTLLAGNQNVVFVSTRAKDERRKAVLSVDGTFLKGREAVGADSANNLEHDTALLDRVMEIWRNVLAVPDISPDDNFFDLGGNSLFALTLLHTLQEKLQRDIPLSTLVGLSTPGKMAEALRTELPSGENNAARGLSPQERKGMGAVLGGIPIPFVHANSLIKGYNTKGTRKPIFWCFNAPSFEPARLARELGEDQPLYALFSGVSVLNWREDNAEHLGLKLAEEYFDDVIKLHPRGSFWIGGNCAGARVAWSLVRLIREAGRSVDRLCFMEYFENHLYDYEAPLLLLCGKQSHLQVNRKFGWPESGWQKRFRRLPEVSWIPGEHGAFFNDAHIAVLGEKIGRFFNACT